MRFDELYNNLVNETIGIEAASSDNENLLRILDNLKAKSPQMYQQFVDRLMDTVEQLKDDARQEQEDEHKGWPGDGSGEDDFADYNQMEGNDY
jgi:ribosome assembly protein YihI (activator of Der GTPase)